MKKKLPKLIVILGPTASGKTDLSIKLAKQFDGEVVSADSRQIYRGLDIGSAKITQEKMQDIPHYLLDVADPGNTYTLAEYQKNAFDAIDSIIKKEKNPFLVGGTPLYLYSIIDNYTIPKVAPNQKRRKELENMDKEKLQKLLKKIDPETYKKIDTQNPRRIIRAIEVVETTGSSFFKQRKKQTPKYQTLKIAPYHTRENLYERIDSRTDARVEGIVKEIKKLLEGGVSSEWLKNLGLEYRFITQGILKELEPEEAVQKLKYAIHSFTRRQYTWLRKDEEIHWIKNEQEATNIVQKFLQN